MCISRLLGIFLFVGFSLACFATGVTMGQHEWALRRLEAEALASHPSILGARDSLEQAGQQTAAARWQFFPTPRVSAVADDEDASLSVGFDQPLLSSGRLGAQKDQALAAEKAARQSLSEARFALSLDVVGTYGALIADLMVSDVYRAGLRNLQALRAMIKKRVDARISAQSDYLFTNARYTAIKDNFNLAKSRVNARYQHLSQLLGRTMTFTDVGAEPLSVASELREQRQEAIVAHALATHPKIRHLQAELDAARSVVRLKKSAYLPKLSLQGQYEKHTRQHFRDEAKIEIVLKTDLSAGLSDYSQLQAAKAAERATAQAVLAAEREVADTLEQVFVNYRSLARRANHLAENVERLEGILSAYKRAFLLGHRSWVDVLNMLRENIETHADLVRVRAQLFTAEEMLKRYEELGKNDV